MLPVKFDFTVNEDRRGTNFEGLEAGHTDPDRLALVLGPPKATPSVCGFGDCQDDDKDAPQQTTLWEFDPAERTEILTKVKTFLGLSS
jgi:hypothetical protein